MEQHDENQMFFLIVRLPTHVGDSHTASITTPGMRLKKPQVDLAFSSVRAAPCGREYGGSMEDRELKGQKRRRGAMTLEGQKGLQVKSGMDPMKHKDYKGLMLG